MRSFEEQCEDLIARAKQVGASTPRVEIRMIRDQIKVLDYRLARADLSPERRARLTQLSWQATKELERRRYALEHPPITGPERTPDSVRDRRRER